ncbi:DUF4177 domain-containing protein [Paracoccus sp. TK19116]|uniref:DUF4177 domain-containing protein n=1 Tax=Paracoccus albicereus TaxID=2922394 RepID=A0ABT1MTF5_9RHOB|nr:DUF4177 domain-containing protein [Paracoccus albicereus]MCQ0971605.1 DUF4177 domain-containing protein [Paracoccus albicereus]
MRYEYTVIPAPTRGEKTKGAKTPVDRYAVAFSGELNRLAAEGWEYVRAEVLPSEERTGLTGRTTIYHNILVFRRAMPALDSVAEPAKSRTPQPEYPVEAAPPPAPKTPPATPPVSPQVTDIPAEKPAESTMPRQDQIPRETS